MITTGYFRWREADSGTVVELARSVGEDGGDVWVPIVIFVRAGEDGGWTAIPKSLLIEQSGSLDAAEGAAHRHLMAWEECLAAWGREHPGGELPAELLERS